MVLLSCYTDLTNARRMPTEAGAKAFIFSVERTRDTVETVEVMTVLTA
jgi:hypothetical protein